MSMMDPGIAEEAADESSSGDRPLEYHFNPESPRILVVDDEKVIREILSDFLSLEGYCRPRRGRMVPRR
jgi:PleD family two-component response regulator